MKTLIYPLTKITMLGLVLSMSHFTYAFDYLLKYDLLPVKANFSLLRNDHEIKNSSAKMINIEAVGTEAKVSVFWHISGDRSIDYFVLERSRDNKKFEKVITIDAANYLRGDYHFHETDFNPYKNVTYYRLKKVSVNKTVTYSNTINVKTTAVKINPDRSKEKNSTLILKNKEVLLVFRNNRGEEFFSKLLVSLENSEVTTSADDTNLKPGVYMITGSSDNNLFGKTLTIK